MKEAQEQEMVSLTEPGIIKIRGSREAWMRWKNIFASPGHLRIVVQFPENIAWSERQAQSGPVQCRDGIGLLTELLMERFCRRMRPAVFFCSQEETNHNGQQAADGCCPGWRMKQLVEKTAFVWMEYGYCGSSFLDWLKCEVSYED